MSFASVVPSGGQDFQGSSLLRKSENITEKVTVINSAR
jgi:hypothetical protein